MYYIITKKKIAIIFCCILLLSIFAISYTLFATSNGKVKYTVGGPKHRRYVSVIAD